MRLREFAGIPIEHTAKAYGLKKVTEKGKTYYKPVRKDPQKLNEPL